MAVIVVVFYYFSLESARETPCVSLGSCRLADILKWEEIVGIIEFNALIFKIRKSGGGAAHPRLPRKSLGNSFGFHSARLLKAAF